MVDPEQEEVGQLARGEGHIKKSLSLPYKLSLVVGGKDPDLQVGVVHDVAAAADPLPSQDLHPVPLAFSQVAVWVWTPHSFRHHRRVEQGLHNGESARGHIPASDKSGHNGMLDLEGIISSQGVVPAPHDQHGSLRNPIHKLKERGQEGDNSGKRRGDSPSNLPRQSQQPS